MPNEYDAWYQISSFGRVKSMREKTIMKQYLNEKGYLTVGFKSLPTRKKFKVHRLVGFAFIPNPDNKPEINHDDFDKKNNHISNLHWATQKENTHHAQIGGRRPMGRKIIVPVGEYPVRCQKVINSETNFVYESVYHLSEEIGVAPKEIRRKLSGERPNNTPYQWLKGRYTIFYKKRYERDMARFNELKKKIYS